MLTHNVTLSNALERKYKKWSKVLILNTATGPCTQTGDFQIRQLVRDCGPEVLFKWAISELSQSEAERKAILVQKKPHFHKKGCVFSFCLKVRVCGTR